MKVLFLDFDGVLNTHKRIADDPQIFSPSSCKNLSDLLKDEKDLKIVVSSSWRVVGLENVKRILSKNGIDEKRIIDITGQENGNRGYQIKCWLDKHPEIKSFAIVDDDSDMEPYLTKLVKTSSWIGLTKADTEKIKKILHS